METMLDLAHFVRHRDNGLSEIQLALEAIGRRPDIAAAEGAVRSLPGVRWVRFNLERLRVTVRWMRADTDPASLLDALEQAGFRAYPLEIGAPTDGEEARQARWLLSCLAIAGFAAMNIMLLSVSVWAGNITDITPETRDVFHWLSALIALPAAAYAGQPFFRSAMAAISARRLNMDVPISVGVLLALATSVFETTRHAEHAYFDSAVTLLFFLLCGRYLDLAMRRRTRSVAGNLAALKADVADRLDSDGTATTIPTAALQPGDRLLVRPGTRVPADGVVLDGHSEIDESFVTGETEPRTVAPGDAVHCGNINFASALTMRVTAAGQDTLLAEIERLLDRASGDRSRYLGLADRVARLYAPAVHLTALLSFAGWLLAGASLHDAILIAIAVLIITCPCALALAVPAVQVVAAGRLFRHGILLNSADALERLAEVDSVILDKTGTLTLPDSRASNLATIDPEIRALAERLAMSSHHPLARALAVTAIDRRPLEGAVEEAGLGVRAVVEGSEARLGSLAYCDIAQAFAEADGTSSLLAFRHGEKRAVLHIRQRLRPDAASTVARLSREGYATQIISGDRDAVVADVASAVGVTVWSGRRSPADKIVAIEAMRAAGQRPLMVGDGLNDAPALAAAYASIAPITASALSQARADAIFLGEGLSPIADTLATARQARKLMIQNLVLAIVYNGVAVPLAIAGLVTPLVAAAAMSGSSVLVTLNALRARNGEPKAGSSRRRAPVARKDRGEPR